FELALELEMVLDDAVVHDRDVTGDVRMRVGLARPAVCRPTRVADPEPSFELSRFAGAKQVVELPHGAHDLELGAHLDRQARGVVAAVFESPEAVEQDGSRRSGTNVANDAAHLP